MGIYLAYMASPIIIYLLMSVVCQKDINRDKRLQKAYLIICGILMALMIGLRNQNNGSGDSQIYYGIWEQMSVSTFRNAFAVDMEPGFQFTTWALSHAFPWGQCIFIFSGAFFAWSICSFIYKNAYHAPIALLVFNCLGLFNFMVQGMRQAIAMSICLWAIEQCKKKNLFKFLFIIFIACNFHASAIVFCVVYVIANLKINTKSIIYFSALATIGVATLSYALAVLNFVMNENYGQDTGSEQGGVVAMLISGTIVAFGLYYQDKKSPYYAMFIYMTLIAVAAMIARNSVNQIAERIAHYFAFAQMVVMANSLYVMKMKELRVLVFLAVALLCLGVAKHKASYSTLVPYSFYWEYRLIKK